MQALLAPRSRPSFDLELLPHLGALHAIARGIVGSDDLASDAVQEALVCLWREREPLVDVRGWLVRTVVHKSLHLVRARTRREEHERNACRDRAELCPLCDPSRLLEDDETRARLEHALDELSRELRDVFVLRQEQGLEYDAIARRLAIPIGTVRSRLSRARERLVELLESSES